jgi:hypothetical protein
MSDLPQSAPQPAVKADPKWFVMGGVVSIVAWLALIPLLFLIYQSFRTPGTARKPAVWTLGNYLEAYSSSDTLVLFANSVEFAAGTAIGILSPLNKKLPSGTDALAVQPCLSMNLSRGGGAAAGFSRTNGSRPEPVTCHAPAGRVTLT